jgi:hypothetical protein
MTTVIMVGLVQALHANAFLEYNSGNIHCKSFPIDANSRMKCIDPLPSSFPIADAATLMHELC